MAATVSLVTPRVSPQVKMSGIKMTITASSTTYDTASGGLPFDIFAALAAAQSSASAPISYKDILGFIGITRDGYTAQGFAVGTVTPTSVPCTVHLWNGTSELGDGSVTVTLDGVLLIARGGAN